MRLLMSGCAWPQGSFSSCFLDPVCFPGALRQTCVNLLYQPDLLNTKHGRKGGMQSLNVCAGDAGGSECGNEAPEQAGVEQARHSGLCGGAPGGDATGLPQHCQC